MHGFQLIILIRLSVYLPLDIRLHSIFYVYKNYMYKLYASWTHVINYIHLVFYE